VHSRLPGTRKQTAAEPTGVNGDAAVNGDADVVEGSKARQRRVSVALLPPSLAQAASRAGMVTARYRSRPWLPGWAFAAVTLAPALLAVAWLLPGVATLLAGRLLLTPMVIIFVPLAIALCYFAMRQLPVSWPEFMPGGGAPGAAARPAPAHGRPKPAVPAWPVIATIAITAGFAVWQAAEMSQQIIVARAAGGYLQYAYWIAHHGTARIPVSTATFGGAGVAGPRFASPGFLVSPDGAVVSPAFLAGLPLVLAGGIWSGGVSGGLLAAPLIGACAVLSFAGLAGRLVGPRWAPAGALVLAVALPEQYVSRTTLSEPLVQVLLFGGLSLVLDSLALRQAGAGKPGLAAAPGVRGTAWQELTLAGLGGLALGLTVLANIGSLSLLLPALPLLAIMFVARLPLAGPLVGGLVLGAGAGVAEAAVLARPYLSSLGPQLHDIGLATAGFAVATALVAPLAFPGFRARVRAIVSWRLPVIGLSGTTHRVPLLGALLEGLAVIAPVAALTGLAIRPSLDVARGGADPYFVRYVAALQRLGGLPVDGRRQYYEASLNWVIWYVGLPVVLLACVGAAVLGRRCLRAALQWRGASQAARMWALPLLVFGWSAATVLWDPATFPDQPWASRRLVPVVLPGLICLALWMCARIRLRGAELGAGVASGGVVAACCVLALGLPAAVTTFDPGYVAASASGSPAATAGLATPGGSKTTPRRLAARGMALRATYAGETAAVSGLCAAIGPSASVVIVDLATASAFTQVVRGMCDTPAARMDGAPSTLVEQVVTAIEHSGRRPVLLGSTAASVALVGAAPRQVLALGTTQDAQDLTGPPASPWPLTYTVWLASPSSPAA
jgi:hypothetical protein